MRRALALASSSSSRVVVASSRGARRGQHSLQKQQRQGQRRALSTAPPGSTSTPPPKEEPGVKDDGFGWVPYAVFAVIGSLGAWFWRASKAQSNKEAQVAIAAGRRPLAEVELRELRTMNGPDLTCTVFAELTEGVLSQLGGGKVSYPQFIGVANDFLDRPLQVGHYLDRLVLSHVARRSEEPVQEWGDVSEETDELEVGFLLTAVSCAAGGTAEDRAPVLFRVAALRDELATRPTSENQQEELLSRPHLERLVRWLLETGQIASTKLVVETDVKYPAVEFTQKTPAQILDTAMKETKIRAPKTTGDDAAPSEEEEETLFSVEDLRTLLAAPALSL